MNTTVWAPHAKTVQLLLKHASLPMEPTGEGNFSCSYRIHHGEDYAFSLNGQPPLPDPRSPWQPDGIHGWSRGLDHDRHQWRSQKWHGVPLEGAVIYELHVGTFTREGTFGAAVEQLEMLTDLGVTMVELMPVSQFPGDRGWGYDTVNLFATHEAYGTPEDLKHFIDACHERDLGVVLDVNLNHVAGEAAFLSEYGPYFFGRSPWGATYNLDQPGCRSVRRYLLDNAQGWFEHFRVDALRLDSVETIQDTSEIHFLLELARETQDLSAALRRALHLIAENHNQPRVIMPPEAGGFGLHAQWNKDFHRAIHALLTGERGGRYQDYGTMRDLATATCSGFVFVGQESRYRGRSYGAPLTHPDFRLVGYWQNHDEVGNRPDGTRLGSLLTPGLRRVAAGLTLLGPHIPLLFQGEEWDAKTPFFYFTDSADAERSERRRAERNAQIEILCGVPGDVPNPDDKATFVASKLDWTERTSGDEVLSWYRELIALRRRISELAAARFSTTECTFDARRRWLAVRLKRILIVANFSSSAVTLPLVSITPPVVLATSSVNSSVDVDKIVVDGESLVVVAGDSIAVCDRISDSVGH